MIKVFSMFVALGILGAATTALAADTTHRRMGRIKSVDLIQHVITLDDGSTFKAARGVNLKRIKPGENVTVTTSKFGGTLEASAITPTVD